MATPALGLSSHLSFPGHHTTHRHSPATGPARVELRRPTRERSNFRAFTTQQNAPTESPELQQSPPIIELEFIGPEPGPDGAPQVDRVSVVSGEKLLRNTMIDTKLELYGLYGKVMNCGGGGSCGTCLVEIIDGSDLLNERTDAEHRYLKKNPKSWRLACQTIVGNKSNSGKVTVQRLPQKKK